MPCALKMNDDRRSATSFVERWALPAGLDRQNPRGTQRSRASKKFQQTIQKASSAMWAQVMSRALTTCNQAPILGNS